MNDIDEVRKRLQKRKGHTRPLNDRHFKRVYNGMIKGMVVLLVGLSLVTYFKLNPASDIKNYILNDTSFKTFTSWVSTTFLGFLPDQDIKVNSEVQYTLVKDNYYKNTSNEVINFDKGKVIYTGKKEDIGSYVVVLFENDVQVTYANMQEVFVELYDNVESGMILGTYEKQIALTFEHLGKEISYETFIGME